MTSLSRRDFARFLAISGSASLLPTRAFAQSEFALERWGLTREPLPLTPREMLRQSIQKRREPKQLRGFPHTPFHFFPIHFAQL